MPAFMQTILSTAGESKCEALGTTIVPPVQSTFGASFKATLWATERRALRTALDEANKTTIVASYKSALVAA